MVNRYRGEVALVVDGQAHVLRLTLGALAELEAALETGSLVELVERFEGGGFSARDLVALLGAGLRGAGLSADILQGEIEGGPIGAAKVAAQLLARSFSVPDA